MRNVKSEQSRAELFASQVLVKDIETIKVTLHKQRIVVGIDGRSALTRQGQIGFITAINILARLGALAPNIYLDVPDNIDVLPCVPLLPAGWSLRQSALSFMQRLISIQPEQLIRNYVQNDVEYDIGLFVGRQTVQCKKVITIGSRDWLAVVNPSGGQESITEGVNPLGVLLAAALGSTEVVKHLWISIKDKDIIIEPMTQRTVVSTFDFSINSAQPKNPVLPSECCFGHACIFGLGAIGSACNFVLGCFGQPDLSLDLVDNDVIEISNEERLFTSDNPNQDIHTLKVIHAQQFLKSINVGAHVFAYKTTFERFVEVSRDRLSYVFCCLDSVTARRLLQTELASIVVNGGTDLSRWMVSLHDFDHSENACLLDLYTEQPENQRDSVKELVELLKMNRDEIRQLELQRRRIDGRIILRAQQQELDPAKKQVIGRYTGLTFEQALAHVCSTGTPSRKLPAATISFVSLIPAVFMVADFVKRRVLGWNLQPGAPNVFQADSLRSLEKGTFVNILASENCYCQSKRYIDAFAKRQEIRKPHLNEVFSFPSHEKTEQVRSFFPYRQPQRPIRQVVNPQRVANAINAPNPLPPELPNRLPSKQHCLLGITVYLIGMLGVLFLLCLFIRYESHSKGFFNPWQIISLAWAAGKNPSRWFQDSVVLCMFTFAYWPLMKAATWVMVSSKCPLLKEQNAKKIDPHKAYKLLSKFFTVTGLPIASLGILLFGLLNLRVFLTSCQKVGESACCAIIPLFIFFFFLIFMVAGFGIAQTFEHTQERCAWVFNLPIKKKK
jgi:molybdopterin/thiamine biosynthesis adenylyltransferase